MFLLVVVCFKGLLGNCILYLGICGSVDYIYMNINVFVMIYIIIVNNRCFFKDIYLKWSVFGCIYLFFLKC